ncbi:hypothetical protein D9M73_211120 [compost metagenome]
MVSSSANRLRKLVSSRGASASASALSSANACQCAGTGTSSNSSTGAGSSSRKAAKGGNSSRFLRLKWSRNALVVANIAGRPGTSR